MTPEEIRFHIRYSGWASRKLVEAAHQLKGEDLTRPNGSAFESVLGTLKHVYFADRVWYGNVTGQSEFMMQDVDLNLLATRWQELQGRWEAWAAALQETDLGRILEHKSLDGTPRKTPLLIAILHVVNHATLHRGQVMAMMRQLGVKPPSTDLIFFYREQPDAAT